MKISELIEYLKEYMEDKGDLDVAVQDNITGELCEIIFDEQIGIHHTIGGKPVLAFSSDGNWGNWNRYQAN